MYARRDSGGTRGCVRVVPGTISHELFTGRVVKTLSGVPKGACADGNGGGEGPFPRTHGPLCSIDAAAYGHTPKPPYRPIRQTPETF